MRVQAATPRARDGGLTRGSACGPCDAPAHGPPGSVCEEAATDAIATASCTSRIGIGSIGIGRLRAAKGWARCQGQTRVFGGINKRKRADAARADWRGRGARAP